MRFLPDRGGQTTGPWLGHLGQSRDTNVGRPRLTRRGRVVVVLAVMVALLAIFSLGRVSTQAATTRSHAAPLAHVVVLPGESLWQIAERVDPSADPRAVIDTLVSLNHLSSGLVTPGEVLVVPARPSP